MSGRVCCCSSEYCRVNGCQADAADRDKFQIGPPRVYRDFPDLPNTRPVPQKQPPLTEEDIRRIFQEEMRKFKESLSPGVFRGPL